MWFEGRVSDDATAVFDLSDRGLLLADGLFETVLVVAGVPFRLDDHLARLRDSAAVLGLAVDTDLVAQAILALAQRLLGPGVVRATVTRGAGPRGLAIPRDAKATVFATAAPWSADGCFQPRRLITATIRRNASSPLSRIKSLGYLDNILALEEAVAAGADDALLLSTSDRVACTSAGNIIAVMAGQLVTPPLTDGVLPGVTRALVLGFAPQVGFRAVERSIGIEELRCADAVLTTNSVRLICPVVSIDGRVVGEAPSAVARDLQALLLRAIATACGEEAGGGTINGPLPPGAIGAPTEAAGGPQRPPPHRP